MVYGIGCDLCSIARMKKSLLGPHGAVFARRVFGPAEQAALGLPLAEEEGSARRTAHTVASAAADFAALLPLRDRSRPPARRGTGLSLFRPERPVGGSTPPAGTSLPEP